MTDYLFQEVPVFDRLGVNLMLARKVRIDVLDTVLDLTSPGLKQSGQPVPYVTTDELGRATFTNTQGFARLRGPKGFEQIVYSPDFLKQVAAADNRTALARNPDSLIAGTVTRDSNGAATGAPVVWPDGTPGTYTALVVSTTFPGAVDSYRITYGSPVTRTFTQPTITRDASGAAVTVPAITVS